MLAAMHKCVCAHLGVRVVRACALTHASLHARVPYPATYLEKCQTCPHPETNVTPNIICM